MRALTVEEVRKWCPRAGLKVLPYDILRYKHPKEYKFFIEAPELHRKIVFLAQTILNFREGTGFTGFSGGLLWLQQWSIGWPGWRILEAVRRAHGELRPLEIAPAQSFREDEILELHIFLIQTIAFGWRADLIPYAKGFFVLFKTNGYICIAANSLDTLKELRAHFQEWNPTDEDPMVVKTAAMEKARKKARQKKRPNPK